MPPKRAVELLLTGRRFDAHEAYELGLVTRLAPRDAVRDEALELARAIAANAPIAVAETMSIVRRALEPGVDAW